MSRLCPFCNVPCINGECGGDGEGACLQLATSCVAIVSATTYQIVATLRGNEWTLVDHAYPLNPDGQLAAVFHCMADENRTIDGMMPVYAGETE